MDNFFTLLLGGQDYALYAVTMIFGFVGAFYMWYRQTQKGLKKSRSEFDPIHWLKDNWKRVLWGTTVPAAMTIFIFTRFSNELFSLLQLEQFTSATPFLGLLLGLGHEAFAKMLDRGTNLFTKSKDKNE